VLGGTVSAEHGIGKLKRPYLERMVGADGIAQMRRTKQALDPDGLLCPGNLFESR
jgi:glycolate oxidase